MISYGAKVSYPPVISNVEMINTCCIALEYINAIDVLSNSIKTWRISNNNILRVVLKNCHHSIQ
jgi:hypothetical protein